MSTHPTGAIMMATIATRAKLLVTSAALLLSVIATGCNGVVEANGLRCTITVDLPHRSQDSITTKARVTCSGAMPRRVVWTMELQKKHSSGDYYVYAATRGEMNGFAPGTRQTAQLNTWCNTGRYRGRANITVTMPDGSLIQSGYSTGPAQTDPCGDFIGGGGGGGGGSWRPAGEPPIPADEATVPADEPAIQ